MVFAYCIILVCSSCYNFTDKANYHFIISNLKIIVLLCAVEWETEKYGKNALKNIWRFLLIILSANTASIILFPNGLYQIEYVWNEWGAKDVMRQWILGNKNSQTVWYLLLLIITYFLQCYHQALGFSSDYVWRFLDDSVSNKARDMDGVDWKCSCNGSAWYYNSYYHYVSKHENHEAGTKKEKMITIKTGGLMGNPDTIWQEQWKFFQRSSPTSGQPSTSRLAIMYLQTRVWMWISRETSLRV